jgi:hypothetical protein
MIFPKRSFYLLVFAGYMLVGTWAKQRRTQGADDGAGAVADTVAPVVATTGVPFVTGQQQPTTPHPWLLPPKPGKSSLKPIT